MQRNLLVCKKGFGKNQSGSDVTVANCWDGMVKESDGRVKPVDKAILSSDSHDS